jgi:hypothetical protein
MLTRLAVLGRLGTIAVAAIALGSWDVAPQGSAAPGQTVYVAATGSDAGSCTASAPCKSLDRAYRVAQPGQVVEVAGGSYPAQAINADGSKTSSDDVVFRPAAGAGVRVGSGDDGLDVKASHVTVSGFAIDWWNNTGSDVTMQGIKGQSFFVSGGSDVTVDGGDYGPYEPACAPGSTNPEHDNPTVSTSGGNIVIRGAVFHDMTNRNCSASHMDCLQVASVNGMTIEDNKFFNCFSNGLILTGDFGSMNNITVQNNWFGPTLVNNPSLNWNPTRDCPGAVVRYNTFVGSGVRFECSADSSGQMYGNIVPTLSSFDCGAWKAVQHHNVSDGGRAVSTCGTGSYVAPDGQVGMVDRAHGDYHLAPGSEAIGRGEAGALPRNDIDGDVRPLRASADAGADEREPALLVLGRRIGMAEIGMSKSQVERSYGASRVRFLRTGPPGVGVASYTQPGGRLTVTYSGDRVVGLATTSAYYTTSKGFGVGAELTGPRGQWSPCSKAYRRSLGPVTLDVRPAGGEGGNRIARIAMTRSAYAVC